MNTPYYYIKEKDLLFDIELLENSLKKYWGNYIMGYSVKTNSLPWLLKYLQKKGFFAEVVSDTEYDLALKLGYNDDTVIYNGPIKDKQVFFKVLENEGYVNLDSNYELDWLEERYACNSKETCIGGALQKEYAVGLRVNCDISSLCPDEVLVEEDGGRFGYCYENGSLSLAIDRLKALPNVKIAGIHLHSSTQSRSVKVYAALAKMAVKLAKEYDLSLEYVDMGGGYFGGRTDKPDYSHYIPAICAELAKHFKPEATKLIVEPGVSLISRASTFVTSVIDTKDVRGIRYVVTDGSRVNLNPQVTRHIYPHHFELLENIDRKYTETQWICGSTCMEYDRLFKIEKEEELVSGDKIIYDTAGGYTICLTPLFIHYFPAVYVEHMDGSLFTARKPWTNTEYMQNNFTE